MKHPAMVVKLYTTVGCHLCEQALAMLQNLAPNVTIVEVEIAADEQLLEKYGLIIPVISAGENDMEINWPFSRNELYAFIQQQSPGKL